MAEGFIRSNFSFLSIIQKMLEDSYKPAQIYIILKFIYY